MNQFLEINNVIQENIENYFIKDFLEVIKKTDENNKY